jgi:hypothetical protein
MKEVALQLRRKAAGKGASRQRVVVCALLYSAGSCSPLRINSLEDEFQSDLSDTRATGMPDALAEIARFDDSSYRTPPGGYSLLVFQTVPAYPFEFIFWGFAIQTSAYAKLTRKGAPLRFGSA